MSNRIQSISGQFPKNKQSFVQNSFDYFNFSEFLTHEENEHRLKVREFCDHELAPTINTYVEKAEFPEPLIQKIKQAKLFSYFLKEPYGKGASMKSIGSLMAELARVDGGLATFMQVSWSLLAVTVEMFASEEQKQKWLPRIRDFDLIGGWGLTEPKYGSDASGLQTTAQKVQGGYLINGEKRWIGNGNRDVMAVWAKNLQSKQVECFFVDMKSQGITSTVIKHKLALRIVQNCEISFQNVFVPEENRLPKAISFNEGTNKVLFHSRVFVSWIVTGMCMGVYEAAAQYAQDRKQFGVPIASFQLIQEKLSRIMAYTQVILLISWRITDLYEKNQLTLGQASMAKAFVTERAREVCRLGREIMGGNGIVSDNYCIKALNDIEAIYTYEGTYDVNSLIAGRELTEKAAFKASSPKK